MKLGKAEIVRRSLFLLFLLATVSALGQRANFDVNFGQVPATSLVHLRRSPERPSISMVKSL